MADFKITKTYKPKTNPGTGAVTGEGSATYRSCEVLQGLNFNKS